MTKSRKIGVEIEFAGVSIEDVVQCVVAEFDGAATKNHTFEYFVETSLGKFRIELDSLPLKDLAEKAAEESDRFALSRLGLSAIRGAVETIVPCEIVTPPLDEAALTRLDNLVVALRKRGARGTNDGILYAFGVHFNPELTDISADILRDYLRSFSILRPWIVEKFETDFSRQVTSYIGPHAEAYIKLIMEDGYAPNLDHLISDYLAHNPTRNRDLDMLPMFAHLDEEKVRAAVGPDAKVNARPTFHYRLPNADLGNPDWSVSQEWQSWLAVEKLANDREKLDAGRRAWRKREEVSESTSDAAWLRYIETLLQ